jgi:hypothetical protein
VHSFLDYLPSKSEAEAIRSYCGIRKRADLSEGAGQAAGRNAQKRQIGQEWVQDRRFEVGEGNNNYGLLSRRRMGARARASGKRFARARSFCLRDRRLSPHRPFH